MRPVKPQKAKHILHVFCTKHKFVFLSYNDKQAVKRNVILLSRFLQRVRIARNADRGNSTD